MHMRRVTTRASLLGALLLSLSEPSRAEAPVRVGAGGNGAHRLPGFRSGEGFAFTFSVGAIDAGRARISVGEPARQKGRRTIAILGEARAAPWLSWIARLDNEYKVMVDADALAPRQLTSVEHGLRERRVRMDFDQLGASSRVLLDVEKPDQKRREVRLYPSPPLDAVSALFTLRAAPLRDGDTLDLLTFDGPAFYKCRATVVRREKIELSGAFAGHSAEVVRVDLYAVQVDARGRERPGAPRRATLWLSDDERRIPYRVDGETDFGRCELELVSYREGRDPSRPRREPPPDHATLARPLRPRVVETSVGTSR